MQLYIVPTFPKNQCLVVVKYIKQLVETTKIRAVLTKNIITAAERKK